MVQMEKVLRIRQAWINAGKPPCEHKRFEREHHLGGGTGDYACLDCGASWPRGQEPPGPTGEYPPGEEKA